MNKGNHPFWFLHLEEIGHILEEEILAPSLLIFLWSGLFNSPQTDNQTKRSTQFPLVPQLGGPESQRQTKK
jgi:hypothetical protein